MATTAPAEAPAPAPDPMTICASCNQAFEQTSTKAELPCHHFFHTQCLIVAYDTTMETRGGLRRLECSHCNIRVVEEETIVQIHEMAQNERNTIYQEIANEFDNNTEFRQDVLKYKKALTARGTPNKALSEIITKKQKELLPQVTAIKNQLKSIYQLAVDDIKAKQEYKECMKAVRRVTRLKGILYEKYNLRTWDIKRALRNKRGFRSWPRHTDCWHFRGGIVTYRLRRIFRLHF